MIGMLAGAASSLLGGGGGGLGGMGQSSDQSSATATSTTTFTSGAMTKGTSETSMLIMVGIGAVVLLAFVMMGGKHGK
jgi:hypothetical protein